MGIRLFTISYMMLAHVLTTGRVTEVFKGLPTDAFIMGVQAEGSLIHLRVAPKDSDTVEGTPLIRDEFALHAVMRGDDQRPKGWKPKWVDIVAVRPPAPDGCDGHPGQGVGHGAGSARSASSPATASGQGQEAPLPPPGRFSGGGSGSGGSARPSGCPDTTAKDHPVENS